MLRLKAPFPQVLAQQNEEHMHDPKGSIAGKEQQTRDEEDHAAVAVDNTKDDDDNKDQIIGS